MDRDDALTLLKDQHAFPGLFGLRVIVDQEHSTAVVAAVEAALADGERLVEVRRRPSRTGQWLSLRIEVQVSRAETVLALYAVLRDAEGVRMTL